MAAEQRQWIVVAGGAGSLGDAIVRRYGERRERVLVLDRTPAHTTFETVVARTVDLTSAPEVKEAIDAAIPRSDRITLLVNAAGMIWNEPMVSVRGGALQPHSIDHWRAVLDANLTTVFVVSSHVAARMVRTRGGAIVNFSSLSARGNAGQTAYAAAKAGVEGLTRAMAAELGPAGIRVNAIAPGFVDVASTRAAVADERLSSLAKATPLRRLGRADEIADAVEALASNTFINGVVLDVDGGLRL
ncbi:MAG TPA: SDR family oxidoreductase [Gemmatimonadaceae bacterium]|nr:SDR family oxidoreductase [Gemmatimonadaceae bacterium]